MMTTPIAYPSHFIKPPHNNSCTSTTSYYNNNSMFLSNSWNKMTLVRNNKSGVILNDEINIDNVINSHDDENDDKDDGFTVAYDTFDLLAYGFDRAKKDGVYPDIPFKVTTYGFGSKFKVALGIESGMDMTETINRDVVAMNVNHIVPLGAKPTLFLTPSACPRKKMQSRQITSSIGYGLIVEGRYIIGENVKVGDVLIGLPSNGLHSHGFSLVKRVIKQTGSSLNDILPGTNSTIGELLMAPTAIYVKEVLDIISKSKGGVNSIQYIDYGGFTENIPSLIGHIGAVIFRDSWPVPPIFKWIQEAGKIEDDEMRRTFNMGIGMVLAMSKESARELLRESRGKNAVYRIGKVIRGDGLRYEEKSIRRRAVTK